MKPRVVPHESHVTRIDAAKRSISKLLLKSKLAIELFGLRQVHEKPEGYEISVSRTIEAPVSKAFKAWTDEKSRQKWLSAKLTIRKATTNKSLRITWEGGPTSVTAAFVRKGAGKCQVVAQHSKLTNARAAAKMKNFWGEALDRLKASLE